MNKIIVFPGYADGVFFKNEIEYIKKFFDEIVVISYPGSKISFDALAKEKGFKYYIVTLEIFKTLINVDFYKWLFNKNTVKEIIYNVSLSKIGIKRLLYILYYGFFYIKAKKYIDKEINSSNNDIFLYSFWLSRGAYTIANYSKNLRVKKVISRAHGYDLYEERNSSNYLPFREFINYNLNEIHFISDHGLQYFCKKYNDNVVCSNKYVSRLGTLNPQKLEKILYFKKIICIASCSSVISVKRLDLIIDILANLKISVKWIHIGEGDTINDIINLAKVKLSNLEYYFLGNIDNSEVLAIYEKYDVDFFINMSDSEGVPVSIMEAISMGIPIIARDVGGVKEIVMPSTGLLIKDISNMQSVYRAVNEEVQLRITDVQAYQAKSTMCIKMWDENYNAEKNFNKFFSDLKGGMNSG